MLTLEIQKKSLRALMQVILAINSVYFLLLLCPFLFLLASILGLNLNSYSLFQAIALMMYPVLLMNAVLLPLLLCQHWCTRTPIAYWKHSGYAAGILATVFINLFLVYKAVRYVSLL